MLHDFPRGFALAALALLLAAATGPALAAPASGDDPPGVAALAAEAEATGLSAADARALAGAVAESGALAAATEDEILRASNAGESDGFGASIAISVDRALVGAPGESGPADDTENAGAAYVFERDASGAWAEVQILRASNAGAFDQFGLSVALSGDRVLVSAFDEDGPTDGTENGGAAYVFERDASGAWAEVQILRASNAGEFDQFGLSVALSGDRVLVGAFGEDGPTDGTSRAGAAYVFERDASGAWAEVQILRASNAGAEDLFGDSVALSGDRVLVGAFGEDGPTDGTENGGAAYVFERDASGAWAEVQILRASNAGAFDIFGNSVALSGDRALVGAFGEDGPTDGPPLSGAAYVFERDASGAWAEVQILRASNAGEFDQFGFSVALSGDRALVGAPGESGPADGTPGAGAAYVFERDASGAWAEVQILRASNAGESDFFGFSVALLGDRALVGAVRESGPTDDTPFSGAVYAFSLGVVDIAVNTFTNDPMRGESVFFRGPVTNNGAAPLFVYVYTEMDVPGFPNPFKRNIGGKDLAPGETFQYKDFPKSKNYFPLTPDAPAGTYTVRVFAASDRFGTVIYDQDSFSFVLPPLPCAGSCLTASVPTASSLEITEPSAAPNPFRDATEIRYALAEDAEVDLRVYDALGREVASLVSGTMSAGTHSATLRAGDLPGGTYIWRLAIGGEVTTGRVTLSR